MSKMTISAIKKEKSRLEYFQGNSFPYDGERVLIFEKGKPFPKPYFQFRRPFYTVANDNNTLSGGNEDNFVLGKRFPLAGRYVYQQAKDYPEGDCRTISRKGYFRLRLSPTGGWSEGVSSPEMTIEEIQWLEEKLSDQGKLSTLRRKFGEEGGPLVIKRVAEYNLRQGERKGKVTYFTFPE